MEEDVKSGVYKVYVKAKPKAGQANLAVCALIAKHFAVHSADVKIVLGKTSREKLLEVKMR